MADTSATYRLVIDAQAPGADASAASLEKLRESIAGDTKALSSMTAALRGMKAANALGTDAAKALQAKIAAQKTTIAGATNNYLALGGTFRKQVAPGAGEAGSRFAQLRTALAGANGPLGQLAKGVESLTGAQLGAIAGGVALAAAIVAVGVAAVKAGADVVAFGIATADARRSELLHLEGLTKLRYGYGMWGLGIRQTADSAGFLQGQIDRVSASTAIGREKVAGYAEQLYRMGMRGGNLQAALEGVSIVASAQGDAAASSFAAMAAGAALAGTSVKALAGDAKARLGGIVARQMLSLDVQSRKLRENLGMLFANVKLEGLMRALQTVGELFSQSTATGRALRTIIDAIFPSFDGAFGALGPLAKRFFQGLVIGALQMTIALLKVRNWFRDTFDFSGLDGASAALVAGKVAGMGMAAALGLLGASIALLVAPFAVVGLAVLGFARLITSAYELWAAVPWAALGTSIVQGIAGGIKAGARWVIDAITGLASSAVSAFREKLGIHSPSTVFRLQARAGVGPGIGAGVREGAPAALAAVRAMGSDMIRVGAGEAGTPAAPAARAASSAQPAASRSVHVGELHVHSAATDASGIAAQIRESVIALFEGEALHVGGLQPA